MSVHSRKQPGATLPHEESIRYPAVVATSIGGKYMKKPRTHQRKSVCKVYKPREDGTYSLSIMGDKSYDRSVKQAEKYDRDMVKLHKQQGYIGTHSTGWLDDKSN